MNAQPRIHPRAMQMHNAAQHADHLDDSFNPGAHRFLATYAAQHRKFTAENVTDAASLVGLVAPCHGPWGSVFREALVEEMIYRIDYMPRRNGNPAPLYGSLVFRGSK